MSMLASAPRSRRSIGAMRRTVICCLIALLGTAGFAPAALAGSVVYANTNLGANGWWRNPTGNQLTTALNYNRMSIQENWPVKVILCWNYAQSVFRGVTLPCGWPGNWYNTVFSGMQFHQISDTYGGQYGMQAICENVNPRTAHGYCAWYY